MADKNRVTQKDDLFDSYINNTYTYLFTTEPGAAMPNWERLGLIASEANQWETYRNAWNLIYGIYRTNKERGISDVSVTEGKNEAKADFTDWVTDPDANKLNRIGASLNVTDDDRAVFHIKKRSDNRASHKAPINADIFFGLKGLGGGEMRATCRTTNDNSRASIPKDAGAKAVQIKYKVGTTAPNSVDECDKETVSTKALFNFNAGANNITKKLFAFARWIDTTDDNRAGAWSEMVTVVVS